MHWTGLLVTNTTQYSFDKINTPFYATGHLLLATTRVVAENHKSPVRMNIVIVMVLENSRRWWNSGAIETVITRFICGYGVR